MLSLSRYDLNAIKPGHRIAFIAYDESVKAKAIENCANHLCSNNEMTCIITIDSIAKLTEFEPLFQHHEKMVKYCKRMNKEGAGIKEPHIVVIFTVRSLLIQEQPFFRKLWCNGRHFGISVLADLNPATKLEAAMQGMFAWTFVWGADKTLTRGFYLEYVNYFESFEEYKRYFIEGGIKCMVRRGIGLGNSNAIPENIFYYEKDEKTDSENQCQQKTKRRCCCCCCGCSSIDAEDQSLDSSIRT